VAEAGGVTACGQIVLYDCGFSPFADDTSTAREVAFSKICARVEGTALAARELGL
jgi:5-methyltetrahydropteroyltriglutamate--homocysteine methyltransferase